MTQDFTAAVSAGECHQRCHRRLDSLLFIVRFKAQLKPAEATIVPETCLVITGNR